jgi:hypothetical protein
VERVTDAAFTLVVACGGGMLDAQKIERVVVDLMRFELEAREAARAVAPARASAEIEAALRIEEATRQTLVRAIAHNDYYVVAHPVNAALARLGVAVEEDGDDWRRLARRAAIGLVAVCEENARREQGVYADGARLLAEAVAPVAQVGTQRPAVEPAQTPITALPAAAPIAWATAAPAPAPAPSTVSAGPAQAVAPAAPTASGAATPARAPAAEVAEARTGGRRPNVSPEAPGRTPGFAYRPPVAPNPDAPRGATSFYDLGMAYVARRSAESESWAESSAPQVVSALKASAPAWAISMRVTSPVSAMRVVSGNGAHVGPPGAGRGVVWGNRSSCRLGGRRDGRGMAISLVAIARAYPSVPRALRPRRIPSQRLGQQSMQRPDPKGSRRERGGPVRRSREGSRPVAAACVTRRQGRSPSGEGHKGKARRAIHAAKSISLTTPAARSSIMRTPSAGSGRNPRPLRRRNVAAVTKAVRLLPSMKACALAIPKA